MKKKPNSLQVKLKYEIRFKFEQYMFVYLNIQMTTLKGFINP